MLNFSDTISAEALFERHRAFGERLERARPPALYLRARRRSRAPAAHRLRLGRLRTTTSVALFLLPVLERHDRARFEICCYSTSTARRRVHAPARGAAPTWRAVRRRCPTRSSRTRSTPTASTSWSTSPGIRAIAALRVFAQKPAPVQATWLGYLNTTGLTRIDYRITDAVSDPTGRPSGCTPRSWCGCRTASGATGRSVQAAAAAAPPCVRNGHVTFGSFNQVAQGVAGHARACGREILRQRPRRAPGRSLGVPPGRAHDELLRDLAAAGIARARDLVPFVPLQDYYAWYDEVDIALDTTPTAAAPRPATRCGWACRCSPSPARDRRSRSAASILTTVGLADWIASSPDEYVQRAVDASRNPAAAGRAALHVTREDAGEPADGRGALHQGSGEPLPPDVAEWCAGQADRSAEARRKTRAAALHAATVSHIVRYAASR